jgi:glycerophosphoryl diester phosphodiesterase
MPAKTFNLQGHRGARGLRPENTLPSFEVAFDVGVTSIETDLHLARTGEIILCHDAAISERLCRGAGAERGHLVAQLTLSDLRKYSADRNPDTVRFPNQEASLTPVAAEFAATRRFEPFGLPTLDDLFEFVKCYCASLVKTAEQRAHAQRLLFDLELKRVPGRPEWIGDGFVEIAPGVLEVRVLECLRRHHALERCIVRSFDHRCLRAIKQLEPEIRTAVLMAGTAPVEPEQLALQAGAHMYCPDVNFLDEVQVRRLHAAGLSVVAWTVNHRSDWERLLAWGVDGITTDYPDRLAQFLRDRSIVF